VKVEPVEIYSDETNRAIMRHPGRKFPGVLIQGDNLHSLCVEMELLCAELQARLGETPKAARKISSALQTYLSHYKQVLDEHGSRLPFSEHP